MYRPKYVQKTNQNSTPQPPTQTKYRERQQDQDRPQYQQTRNTDYRKPRYVEKDSNPTQDNQNENRDSQQRDTKKPYRPYRQQRNPYTNRDESTIQFYTELPHVPEHQKKKPSLEDHLQKVRTIDVKKNELKELRRQQKDSLKSLQSGAFKKLQTVIDNIATGEKAIKTLTHDLRDVDKRVQEITEKILGFEEVTDKLERQATRTKNIQQMNVKELDHQIKKLEHRLITETLEKKQINEIRNQIDKCRKLKINNPDQGQQRDVNRQEVLKDKLAKLSSMKQLRRKLKDERHEIDAKLRKIKDEIEELEDERESLEEEKDDFKKGPEYEKTKEFKDEILRLRDEKDREESRYERAMKEYEQEQQLIEYVAWASDVKKTKLEEREQERAQRQKDRQRNDRKDKKDKDGKDQKQGEVPFERLPPPHPYAKEIGYCNFLIQYCQSLKPTQVQTKIQTTQKVEINVEQQLKKGVWAKEKGVQVIVPRKNLNIDEAPEKRQRVRDKPAREVQNKDVGHNLEIERLFEQLKLTVPKAKDVNSLDEAVKKLQEKKEYYQSNFQAGGQRVEERKERERDEYDRKPKPKYEKKGENKEKLKLELADFPALA